MSALHALDSSVPIETLIPHRPPMQLLDRVIAVGPERLLACAQLTPDAPFCSTTGVPSCIGLEYLGQAAAAFFSAQTLEAPETTAPRPGMLIASRSYVCQHGYFPASRLLLVDIAPASALGPSGLVKFRGAIYVLDTGDLPDADQLQRSASALNTLCEFLTTAEPFAQGDLSVYLPPLAQSPEWNPT